MSQPLHESHEKDVIVLKMHLGDWCLTISLTGWAWLAVCAAGGILTVALAIGLGELAYSALHLGGLVP